MMHKLFILMLVLCSTVYAEQSKISRQRYRQQSGDSSKRGKKRNQKRMPTLEQFARNRFPGPDVQLGQKVVKTSSERRRRAKAWQETVLLDRSLEPGSAEQIAATHALLEAKVNPDMEYLTKCGVSFQGSPLANAVRSGNKELVQALLQAGANANMSTWFSSKRGYGTEFPIHGAARVREEQTDFQGYYPKVIQLLHEHGADVNVGGETENLPFAPIHMVVMQRANRAEDAGTLIVRQTATLQELIKCGAKLDKKTFNGETAIELAVKRGNQDIANFLGDALEDHNKSKFIRHFLAFQSNKSPVSMRKAARAISKNRRLQHKNKQAAAASSSYDGFQKTETNPLQ